MIRQLVCGSDRSVDELIIGGLGAMAGLVALAVLAALHDKPVDPQAYGIGAGAILAAMGGGMGARNKLSPPDGEK